VPFRATATFHPAYAGAYGAPGPHAPAVTSRAFDLSLRDQVGFGFSRLVVFFPFDHELRTTRVSDATFPTVAWGVGAHNTCTHVDNRETLFHLASWGFIAVCPETFPEPYPRDERAPFEPTRFGSRFHAKKKQTPTRAPTRKRARSGGRARARSGWRGTAWAAGASFAGSLRFSPLRKSNTAVLPTPSRATTPPASRAPCGRR
jgi:hypothetical protein